jgi:hypothetical protein
LRIKAVLCLVVGIGIDFLAFYAILTNPAFAEQIIISWGFIGVGLTLLGIGFGLIGQANETSDVSQ